MKKKILIGSIIAVTLLLLMPSIPAIQQKSVEEGFKQDIQEKIDSINLNDLGDIEKLDWVRHPILYCFFMIFVLFQLSRISMYSSIFSIISSGIDNPEEDIPIIYNIYIMRMNLLSIPLIACEFIVFFVNNVFDWNW